ncbi:MAG: hypothetical protein KIC76_02140 [Firmicutes bacterium]|nr:hypothetical protein [Bacillota bacterium]
MSLWNKDIKPMLLGEIEEVFDSKEYLYEVKYDGIRVLVFVSKDKVVIRSRYGIDITGLFPEMRVLCKMVKGNVIFDGEIIMLDNNKVSFSKLQKRIHLKNKKTIEFLSKTNPVIFICFDVIYEGKDLINLSLLERKDVLSNYKDNDVFIKSTYVIGDGTKLFNAIKKLDMEGIVAKKINSKYLVNERSDNWLKIKNYKSGDFIILGYINKEESHVISLVLGEHLNKKIVYVGKVILGKKRNLADKILKMKKSKAVVKIKDKDVIYIKPEIKCLIKYLERTENGLLRQPFVP